MTTDGILQVASTSSSATTISVSLPCAGACFPSDKPCSWHEMHHVDEDGTHWCPTGFMLCHEHFGIGTIEGPGACQLWDEHQEA